jgi:hypothetical protein
MDLEERPAGARLPLAACLKPPFAQPAHRSEEDTTSARRADTTRCVLGFRAHYVLPTPVRTTFASRGADRGGRRPALLRQQGRGTEAPPAADWPMHNRDNHSNPVNSRRLRHKSTPSKRQSPSAVRLVLSGGLAAAVEARTRSTTPAGRRGRDVLPNAGSAAVRAGCEPTARQL